MLIIATLYVENESFDVREGTHYGLHRRTDIKGRPETGLLGGKFIVELESDESSYLHDLLFRNIPFSGRLEFRNGDGEIVRNLVWEKAYICSISEKLDILSGQPMTLTVCITPLRMDINRLIRLDRRSPQVYGFWWEEYKEEEVKQAPVEQEEKEEKKLLIEKIEGEKEAFPGQKIKYKVIRYNKSDGEVTQKDRDSVRWAIKVDGKQEDLQETGETIMLEMKQEWAGKEILVMACLESFTEKVSQKTKVKSKGNIYILLYTKGNSEGDEMFKAAALTRKRDIEKSNYFNPEKDTIYIEGIKDMASIAGIVKKNTSQNQTKEFSIWSHGGIDGPTGSIATSVNAIDKNQMSLEGWKLINFNWYNNGDGAVARFFGCRTGLEKGKSFARNISNLDNFKNVIVSGQTKSAFPSQYTNYRLNSESGKDNFIEEQVIDNKTKTVFYITYLVGSKRKSEDWNLNEQNDAYKMQNNVNGKTMSYSYQEGKTK